MRYLGWGLHKMAAEPPHLPKKSSAFIQPKVELSLRGQEPHFVFSIGLDGLFFATIYNTPQQDCISLLSQLSLPRCCSSHLRQNEVHIRPASHLILLSPGHPHRDANYQDQREHFAIHLHRRGRYHKQCWPRLVKLHDGGWQWRRRIGERQPKPGTRLRRGPECQRQRTTARVMRRFQCGQQCGGQYPLLLPAVTGVVPCRTGEERRGGKRAGREGRVQQRRWRPERRRQQAAGDGNASHSTEPEWCWSGLPRCERAQLRRDAEDGRSCVQGVRTVDLGCSGFIPGHMRL